MSFPCCPTDCVRDEDCSPYKEPSLWVTFHESVCLCLGATDCALSWSLCAALTGQRSAFQTAPLLTQAQDKPLTVSSETAGRFRHIN